MIVTIIYGAIVGLALGLTGGGGSLFAIPLLVYGLGMPVKIAIGASLATVGLTALVGALIRFSHGMIELRVGMLFAATGMLGAPLGLWLADQMPSRWLMFAFATLAALIAIKMWYEAFRHPERADVVRAKMVSQPSRGPSCRRSTEGKINLSSRCFFVLMLAGLATGILSGLFGVGGGFFIVPALVFITGISMLSAVATSLLIITLISFSGMGMVLLTDNSFPLDTVIYFVAGSVTGLSIGMIMSKKVASAMLQKGFSVMIAAVAVYMFATA